MSAYKYIYVYGRGRKGDVCVCVCTYLYEYRLRISFELCIFFVTSFYACKGVESTAKKKSGGVDVLLLLCFGVNKMAASSCSWKDREKNKTWIQKTERYFEENTQRNNNQCTTQRAEQQVKWYIHTYKKRTQTKYQLKDNKMWHDRTLYFC